MIKKYKRKHSGWMRRTSRIYLTKLNIDKQSTVKDFLNNYANGVNYTIHRLWSDNNDFDSGLLGKNVTNDISKRFSVTARLAQCIGKQAKENVNSQKDKSKRSQRIPRLKSYIAHLDSRFITIEKFNKNHFDMCLKGSSGAPNIVIPFNKTKHTNKFLENGWELSKSIRLGYNNNGILFIDLIFEKPKPPKKQMGYIRGIDRGYNIILYSSDDQKIGSGLKEKIKKGGKRRKSYHHYITTEENKIIKQLNLDNVKILVMENLKNVKRGTFSRNNNRLLSFWHYAKVGNRLAQRCEELGISIYFKSPWKTSQHCPYCGNIDRRNRKGEKFVCLKCGFSDIADHVGSTNLELLGLAGVYSLRSLPSKFLRQNNVCLQN